MTPVRVLVVDDNRAVLRAVTTLMKEIPRVEIVGQARSSTEALTVLDELGPDLILMDFSMPGMNGFQATRRIKARANAPRVFIMTAHDRQVLAAYAPNSGADAFIYKADFVDQIRELVGLFFGKEER